MKKVRLSLNEAQHLMFGMLKDFDQICRENEIPYWLDYGTLLGSVRHEGFIPWDDDIDVGMKRTDYDRLFEIVKRELPDHLELLHYSLQPDRSFFVIKLKYRKSFSKCGDTYVPWGVSIDVFPKDNISDRSLKFYNLFRKLLTRSERVPRHGTTMRDLYNQLIIGSIDFFGRLRVYSYVVSLFSSKERDSIIVSGLEFNRRGLCNEFHVSEKDIFPLSEGRFMDFLFPIPNNYKKYLGLLYGDDFMLMPKERVTHGIEFELASPNDEIDAYHDKILAKIETMRSQTT